MKVIVRESRETSLKCNRLNFRLNFEKLWFRHIVMLVFCIVHHCWLRLIGIPWIVIVIGASPFVFVTRIVISYVYVVWKLKKRPNVFLGWRSTKTVGSYIRLRVEIFDGWWRDCGVFLFLFLWGCGKYSNWVNLFAISGWSIKVKEMMGATNITYKIVSSMTSAGHAGTNNFLRTFINNESR